MGAVYTKPNIILVWDNMGYVGAVYTKPNLILVQVLVKLNNFYKY